MDQQALSVSKYSPLHRVGSANKAQEIIKQVCFEHDLTKKQLLSQERKLVRSQEQMSSALSDIIFRLHQAGYSNSQIGMIVERDHTTVWYHLNGRTRDGRRQQTNKPSDS